MLRLKQLKISRFGLGLFLLLGSLVTSVSASTNINVSILSAPPPVPQQFSKIGPPTGYARCYMTPSMWYDGIWIPPHQECRYSSRWGISIWTSGYWGCVKLGRHGQCRRWEWYSYHWRRGHGIVIPPQGAFPIDTGFGSNTPPPNGGGFVPDNGGGFGSNTPAPNGGGFVPDNGGGFGSNNPPPNGGGFAPDSSQGGGFGSGKTTPAPKPQGGGFGQ